VVDLDLEKFFDRVNHDKLMHAIARRVTDKRVLRLIGAFLKVGVLEKRAADDCNIYVRSRRAGQRV
jgi:retron-type reverse transcriptase